MTRALGRAVSTAVLGALAGTAWLALVYALWPALRVDFDVTPPPRLVSGVYPVERDNSTGLTFAWTGPGMTLRLPGLDRHVDWTFAIRARGARAGGDNPQLAFLVDGVQVVTRQSATDFETFEVTVPARTDRAGVVIDVRASTFFVPGPNDPRQLGVMLDSLSLAPSGIVLPPRAAFAGTVAGSAAIGATLALVGITAVSAIGSVLLVSAGTAALIGRGFGPYTGYPIAVAQLAVAIGLAVVALTLAVEALRRMPLRNTAKFAVAFSAAAVLLKAAVLVHPDMPIGDALFHAHRFRQVAAGTFYFTSIAPGNYSFPYAPGLYVFALPFSVFLPRQAADMTMLRLIVIGVDAVAAILLYGMIARARADRLAAACAVALYHLIPLEWRIATVGNLTNAFAQSLSVGCLAMISAGSLRLERWGMLSVFTVLLACTFMSHTSAFAIMAVAVLTIAALFLLRGGPALRSPALALGIALLAATAIAVGVYYAHFMETYRAELARIGSETAAGARDAGGRTVAERLFGVPRLFRLYFGIPALALAALGAWHLWRSGARDRLTLAIAGLSIACAGFLILGIVTPVDMRHYLAAIPAVTAAAAIGASWTWLARGAWRAASLALLAWAAAIGIHTWWVTLP